MMELVLVVLLLLSILAFGSLVCLTLKLSLGLLGGLFSLVFTLLGALFTVLGALLAGLMLWVAVPLVLMPLALPLLLVGGLVLLIACLIRRSSTSTEVAAQGS